MSKPVVHVAGPYRDLMQRCTSCGAVLCDYRNAAWPAGDPPPRGWAEGAYVAVQGNTSWVARFGESYEMCGAQA